MVNEQKLHDFVGRMLGDLGAASSIPLVRIGDKFGLYKKLHADGPMTSSELADASGLAERYIREWLSAQAASGFLTYDPKSKKFTLPPEQAMVFAIEGSPVYMMGAYDAAVAMIDNQHDVENAFRTGKGVGWGDQSQCLACATAKFFQPGYQNHIVQEWLPALDGVLAKLKRGARVADVGCGHGVSTAIMADAFPNSEFVGIDFHENSIAAARKHAKAHGVERNTRFETGLAKEFAGGEGYDLVCTFDCLHDMGDPAGASRHIRQCLKPDGTWMIVEPMAGDTLEQNLNPVGRLFYQASTMICVPTSLAQEVGAALGAQAGEAKLREVVTGAGFSAFRRATETPFNMILEARP
jgi:2-polyprenyl-3-methyl-5-hydroxy-6-metoxy-1,4-benzoquinol methylase